jgi:Fur family iron response transcriptional regulator
LKGKLRQAGFRPTRQRVALGWLLFGKGDRHITAEQLFDEATVARIPVSLATVYNTLNQFTEAGLLRQLAIDSSKTYFDTNPTEHHHFFLEEEGELVDMPSSSITIADLPQPPEGMEVAGVEVIVRLRKAKRTLR